MIHQTRGPRGCKGGGVCGRSHTPPPLHPRGSSANLSQPMSTELIDLTHTAAAELGLRPAQVAAAAKLLDGGATVPFAARYRKEATGSLDEVQITAVRDQLTRLRELEKRRESILGSLRERELLTPELEVAVCKASTRAELEAVSYTHLRAHETDSYLVCRLLLEKKKKEKKENN